MSQIQLTNQERIEAIRHFGYTEREAAFLFLAALHGGYFLRRQYCRFLDKEGGGNSSILVQKALAKDHATASTYLKNVNIYHLCARPFYAALGQPDNRNRRDRQPLTIKNKLMGLDFVLAHPEKRYLATEQEKVSYFRRLGIECSVLPTKLYHADKGEGSTARYFVEKYPVFLSTDAITGDQSTVSFCFVDEGLLTVSRFETFLSQYRPLFAFLNRFQVVYVAATPRLFTAAQRVFERALAGSHSTTDASPSSSLVTRLLAHFEARNLYEANQFSSFDKAKLIRLRNDLKEFSGTEHQQLYERWKTEGASVLGTTLMPRNAVAKQIHGTFSHYLLEHNYDLFGSLTAS
jgi:hypothetical protein